MVSLGKVLIVFGLLIVVVGFVLWSAGSFPVIDKLGRLPGDIYIRRGNFSFYFPITTAIVISVVISLVIAMLRR